MEIVGRLSDQRTAEIVDYINGNLRPLASAEQAKCARDRLQLWLEAEPVYSTGKYRQARHDQRLWAFCKRIFPDAGLAQIYFATDGHAIDWHRDAAYAHASAMIINLGRVCLETIDQKKNLTSLELSGGEIIRFNSKLLHRAIHRDDARIGIGLWKDKILMSDPAKRAFEK